MMLIASICSIIVMAPANPLGMASCVLPICLWQVALWLFQEYLLRDPEEEVLPCKRGYVRLTWNKDSRYCVDGILCRTPEELFDLLLTDYQDFELLRRTKGRREVTEADERNKMLTIFLSPSTAPPPYPVQPMCLSRSPVRHLELREAQRHLLARP